MNRKEAMKMLLELEKLGYDCWTEGDETDIDIFYIVIQGRQT